MKERHIMILLFLSAFAVGFSGAVMPGPLMTYTIRKSLSAGPRAGFIIIAGHALLELFLVIVIFLGFDTVLKSEVTQIIIGITGGILLAYMGFDMIHNSSKNKISIQEDGKSDSKNMVVSSIILTATNPYFILWWAIIGLGFIMQSYESYGAAGVTVYYFGHITADVTWYAFLSILVGTTRKFIKEKTYRIIIICLGCVLVFFGGKFIYGAVTSLM
jgi:threonine/homoserine/homoserine lactone efflux protein